MAIPTETLNQVPLEAGGEQPSASFDQDQMAKQLADAKRQERKKRARAGQNTEVEEEVEIAGDQQEEDYQPFPADNLSLSVPEEETEAGSEAEETEAETEEDMEEQLNQELEQARQLQLMRQQIQQQKRLEQLEELAEVSGAVDPAQAASEAGSQKLLDWASRIAPAILLFEFTGTAFLATGYLNAHILGSALGIKPLGFSLAKPKIYHKAILAMVDLGIVVYLLALVTIINFVVYVIQNPVEFRWRLLTDWVSS